MADPVDPQRLPYLFDPQSVPWRRQFDAARSQMAARNALGIVGTGGGGGAPTTAEYVTASPDATLTAERVLTNTATITWDFSTAGQAKANAAAGGGNVSNSGTPTSGQYAKWVTATTIQGVAPATVLSDIGAQPAGSYQPLDGDLTSLAAASAVNAIYYRSAANTWATITIGANLSFSAGTLNTAVTPQAQDPTLTALAAYNTNGLLTQTAADTFTGRTLTAPAAGITVSNGNGVAGNPTLALANDLAALEALAGTNTIYYRSATDTWSAVSIGSNMTFSGGTLNSAAAGGGNVSNVATPTSGQIAQWTSATTIQGVASATVGFGPPQGRLTLQSATPVMTTTQAAKTTIYYTPYVGNMAPIYDGANFTMTSIGAEISVATTDTTKSPAAIGVSKVNDWFVWNDAGTIRIGHGPDWTSDTARAAGTALVMVNGIWLNNASITNGPAAQRGTYVGTTRSDGSSKLNWQLPSAALNGGQGLLLIWNAYNRVLFSGQVSETTASWTMAATGFRTRNVSSLNSIVFVSGLQEDAASAVNQGFGASASDGTSILCAIGVDSTTAFSGIVGQGTGAVSANSAIVASLCQSSFGYHVWFALEGANGTGTVTFFGALGSTPSRNVAGMTFGFPM